MIRLAFANRGIIMYDGRNMIIDNQRLETTQWGYSGRSRAES